MRKLACVFLSVLLCGVTLGACSADVHTTPTSNQDYNNSYYEGDNNDDYESKTDSFVSTPSQNESKVVEKKEGVTLVPMNQTGLINFDKIVTVVTSNIATKRGVLQTIEHSSKADPIFPFHYDDKGYCNEKGDVVIDPVYTYASQFVNGKAFVRKTVFKSDNKSVDYYIDSIIDNNGNTLYAIETKPGDADKIQWISHFGTADDSVFFFKGITLCCLKNSGSGYDLIEGGQFTNLSNGELSAVNVSGFTGLFCSQALYDFYGNLVYRIEGEASSAAKAFGKLYDEVNAYNKFERGLLFFDNGYANIMSKNGKWGLMKLSDRKMIIDYSYDYVGSYRDGVIPVSKYGKWGAIDINNNEVVPFEFSYIGPFTNGRAFAFDANDVGCVINTKGEILAVYNDKVPCVDCYISPFTQRYSGCLLQWWI